MVGRVLLTELGVVGGEKDRLQSEVRLAVVVQTPELISYDMDGNLVRDGRWVYSWDAENRLVRVMSWGSVDRRRVDWTYDALGRRVRQVRYVWTNSTWQVVEDLKLVSDPVWFGRHIAELNGRNGALVRSYVWGLDLSETLDGAGGVGGLLWVRLNTGPAAGVHFVTYDGNGNVWNLVWASTGTETARYEYGPFGEPLRLTGPVAGSNPFRFSTKRTEDVTGPVLYEYRAYSPALGWWLSREPINEPGHRILTHKGHFRLRLGEEHNLYCALRNRVMNLYDADGRSIVPVLVVGGVSIAAALCIRSQYEVAHKRFGDGSADPAGDFFFHCWTSCRISKACGGVLAQLAGLGKEGLDAFRRAWQEILGGEDETGHGSWLDSLDDLIANQQCIGWEFYLGPLPSWIGALCRRSCEDRCREKVGYYTSGDD